MTALVIPFPLHRVRTTELRRGPAKIIDFTLLRHKKTPLAPIPQRKSKKRVSLA